MSLLYGIGVGPGAPDLLTLRAVRILGEVRTVLAAASSHNEHSIALDIARPHLRPGVRILRLDFPMTRERRTLEAAWAEAAETAEAALREGDAAFLTLGDPLIFSTFGYLARALRERAPDIAVTAVPGVTSFQAAAAGARCVLCEGEESLRILSGIVSGAELEEELARQGSTVILKAYRNFPAIRAALASAGREAVLVSHIGMESEKIVSVAGGPDIPPYLSLVLSKKPAGDF